MSVASISQTDWGNEMLVRLQPLWKDAILCDTTIECKQKSIMQAHSILLAAASPKLFSYFSHAEQGSYTLVTPDVPVAVWRNILNFIYQGRIDINEDELVSTFNFAHRIEMQEFCAHLAKEIEARGLALDQQEAFLRACASQSPRANHVTSPMGVVAPPRPATSGGVSNLSPRMLAVSSQAQVQSPPPLALSKSPLGRQLSSPHNTPTPATAVTPSSSIQPSAIVAMPGPTVSITPLSPQLSYMMGYQPPSSNASNAVSKTSSAPSTPQSTTTAAHLTSSKTPTMTSSKAPAVTSSKTPTMASSRSPKPAMTTPQLQPQPATSISLPQPRERYECDACLQNFNRESALKKHQIDCKKIQDPTTPHASRSTHHAVVSYKNFYTRIPETEGSESSARFKCDLCDKQYQAYQGLYVHLKTKHADEMQAIAQPATRHFRPGQLMSNKSGNAVGESKLINKSSSCPICKKQFKTYATMLAHKKTHSTPPITTRRSSNSPAASSPARPTSGSDLTENEAQKFDCEDCGASFKMKMHLMNHMRKHNE